MKRALLPLVFLVFWAHQLSARDPSFNAQNFKPAPDTGNYFGVYGSRPLSRGQFSLGLTADYTHEPIILENAAGAKLQNLIDREIAAHLAGAIGIFDWLDAGLLVSSAPYLVFRPADDATTAVDESATADTRIRMGDVLLEARFRLLDRTEYPVGIAIVPMLAFPTGSGASFVGNNRFAGGGLLVVESKRIADRFSAALNAGYEVRARALLGRDPSTVPPTDTVADDLVLYGLGLNFSVLQNLDLIGEARGFTLADDLFGSRMRPAEFEGGVRFYPAPRWAVSVGGGTSILSGPGGPVFRAFAGLAYVPEHKGFERKVKIKIPMADSDDDGVPDDQDRCPTEAGTEANGGCPEAPKLVMTPEDFRILTRPIHFDFGKATLRPDVLPVLQTLAEALKTKPAIRKISVEGHCDEIGTVPFNQWLSEQRSLSVFNYLVGQGVDAARLVTIGYGKSRPINPLHTPEARATNRRVEFIFKEVEGMVIPEPVPPSPSPTLPETGTISVPPPIELPPAAPAPANP